MQPAQSYWKITKDEIAKTLGVDLANGLSTKEYESKLKGFGYNKPPVKGRVSPLKIFLKQFGNKLIIILIFVSIFSFFIGERLNGTIILLMLLVNSLIGFTQELKAEKSLERLKKLIVFKTRVLRNGIVTKIDSAEIVPGDIIYLNIGDIVPADLRIIECHNFSINESILTGESIAVNKNFGDVPAVDDIPQNISNGAFMGTTVSSGSAVGICVYSGKETFLGRSVNLIEETKQITNFEKSITEFSNQLLKIVVVLVIFIFIVNILQGRDFAISLLLGITLALGITPEVLPVIITIAISSAAHKLSKKEVIVRRLSALEDWGNMDILCTDKTGTITEGNLKLTGFELVNGKKDSDILALGRICNAYNPDAKGRIFENPIDRSIFDYESDLQDSNVFENEKISKVNLLDVRDFDFETKRVEVLANGKGFRRNIFIVKGATESIINLCTSYYAESAVKNMTSASQRKIIERIKTLEEKGYRVISIAFKYTNESKIYDDSLSDMVYMGAMYFIDPPKKTLGNTIDRLESLNVSLKIITGDSPIITQEVCEQAGFKVIDNKIISGNDIDKFSALELREAVNHYNIFARVTPEQKYKIVNALKESGHVVGYMGDGINDVGALKVADIGISVDSATDVAKDSADIILLRKDLSVLINGVIEGRKTFINTMKFILNTMSSSYGNVLSISLFSVFLKFIPMLPAQILLLDSGSDIQHLSVSTDNVDEEMIQSPKKWDQRFYIKFMVYFGILGTAVDILLIWILSTILKTPELFRSIWFIESVLTENLAAFSIRTRRPFYKSRASRAFVFTTIIATTISLLAPYTELGRNIFGFVPVSLGGILLIVILVSLYLTLLEITKYYFYKKYDY